MNFECCDDFDRGMLDDEQELRNIAWRMVVEA